MAAVLEGLQAYQNTHSSKRIEASCGTSDVPPSSSSRSCSSRVPQGGLLVKFLLSIDRRSDAAAALETVRRGRWWWGVAVQPPPRSIM